MNKRTKKTGRNLIVILLILGGLSWVCSRFIHLGRVEYTDNAQIRRHLIPINSRVQGFIEKVCFDDFQQVHKGDTLVVIESSEYELKVVVPEGISVSTADAYKGICPCMPEVPLKEVLSMPVEQWRGFLRNDFEPAVFRKYPQLEAIKESLYGSGAVYAAMSGSGSALFAIYEK